MKIEVIKKFKTTPAKGINKYKRIKLKIKIKKTKIKKTKIKSKSK